MGLLSVSFRWELDGVDYEIHFCTFYDSWVFFFLIFSWVFLSDFWTCVIHSNFLGFFFLKKKKKFMGLFGERDFSFLSVLSKLQTYFALTCSQLTSVYSHYLFFFFFN
jgi:hypothetical protein